MYKSLITSGCSFSTLRTTERRGLPGWSVHLEEKLSKTGLLENNFDEKRRKKSYVGVGGNGNMLICRRAVKTLISELKEYNGEEILCIVQISELHRHQFWNSNYQNHHNHDGYEILKLYDKTNFNDSERCRLSDIHYRNFQNDVNDELNTLWNIFTLQNFCVLNGVDLFFMFMNNEIKDRLFSIPICKDINKLPEERPDIKEYLIENINWDNFLPNGISDIIPDEFVLKDGHPTSVGYEYLVNKELEAFVRWKVRKKMRKSLTNV